ncbi:sulfatase/phosphatase domain-containing protein [Adhaeretor mobilis]|nr:sulfatase/phosphatase domain-containing protein [Adhaeretor mobilis]
MMRALYLPGNCTPTKVALHSPQLLGVFLLWAFVLGTIGSAENFAADQQPNIVFIFSDDHALQSIGAYGSKINETPNIDRLAQEGAVFLNSFCANSICGPSRACILTGKHSHKNGFLRNGNRFDGNQTTFPKLIQQAGYQAALIGKWHLSSDPTGFDHWEVLPGQGSYYNPDFIQMDGSRHRRMGYCTDIITDLSLDWLQDRDTEKPFLLMCQHKAPHRNWAPPQRHFDLYKESDIPEPPTLHDNYSNRSELLKQNEMSIRDHMMWRHDMKLHGKIEFPKHFKTEGRNGEYARMTEEQKQAWDAQYEPENQDFLAKMRAGSLSDTQILSWKYQRYIKDYLRCIAAVDDGVGRLLAYLDETGLAENTIVIYSSDQGFYLGDHGWYDKRWMFEESMKMPFLIRWPGKITEGSRTPTLIQNIDYAPTFLELAGAPVPPEIQGRSLVPVLRGNCEAPSDWRDAVYYAYYENDAVHNVPKHDGVRSERYKLMYFPRTREWNLFDLEVDPQELTSFHDDPEYAEVLRGMKQLYRNQRSFYEVNSAVIPETRGDDKNWKQREDLLKSRVKKGSDPVRLAFIGDSITHSWENGGKSIWEETFAPRNAVNLGISGDRTEHIIWRLQHGGGFSEIKPEVAVLMIGTNNTGHMMQDPAEVAAGIERILEIIADQSPETKVVLHGIFPRGRTELDEQRLNNQAINQRIRRFADGKQVHWLDIGKVFLEPDNSLSAEIMPDALHLSKQGYQRWAEALEPKLQELGL